MGRLNGNNNNNNNNNNKIRLNNNVMLHFLYEDFDQNLSCTIDRIVAKCILIKAPSWLDLKLKCQIHRKNQKPMPREEQITCHKKMGSDLQSNWWAYVVSNML